MEQGTVIKIAQDALTMILMVSAPMLILGLFVGLMVSVFQATTQIQEQTLAFIPKIMAIFVSIIIFGPWMLISMVDYTRNLFGSIVDYLK